MLNRTFGILLLSALILCSCSYSRFQGQKLSWEEAMAQKIDRFTTTADRSLEPYFEQAGVPYPPKKIALLIFKKNRRLELYAKKRFHWVYIRTFPVYAASGETGPKLEQGDHQVPEGIYRIIGLNPQSHYLLSMQLNYPNSFDRAEAALDGRHQLGGDIFIHGKRSSIGCIAIGNQGIQALFPLVHYVGLRNVKVIIAPNDLRKHTAIFSHHRPQWLKVLYQRIQHALVKFPAHLSST